MIKFNLFTKIITPVVIVGILFSYLGFIYLNTFVEETISYEIEQKIENKIHYTYEHIESEFKLLFYLYGTSKGDFRAQEKIIKKEILNLLKSYVGKTEDIVYLIKPNEYEQLSEKRLLSSELASIIRDNKDTIVIDNVSYKIGKMHFKPWKWDLVYLLNTTSFEDILYKNKLALLGIVYILLLILIVVIIVTFKLYIKKPIDMLLNHFKFIANGSYNNITQRYNTKEIDLLINDVNFMTNSIMHREEDSTKLLALTKQNEEYMEDVLSSQSSIIIINNMTEILDVNDSFYKLFNEFESLDDFKQKHGCVCDYFVKEDGFIYQFSDKNWVEYIVSNPNMLHKVKIHKDNKYYIYTIQAKKSEKYSRTIITMTDITELEKNTNLLEQYKKAVDAGAIVSKSDLSGKITYVNDKFVNVSGYSEKELLGKNHNLLRSENTPSETFKEMWDTIKSKKIWSGSIENRRKDGSAYFVSATIIPILDENKNIYEYVALRYDMTQQVLDKQKAQKAESAKSNFLANMSHEIRTPLNAIIGFTKLLLNFDLAAKEAKYINIIDQSAQNLLGIINDILDISKIENGSLVYEKIEFSPFVEFEGIINLFMVNANDKSISLVSFIDPLIPQKIIGDPLRIKQVLSNLISNAIKFTPKDGTIFSRIELIKKTHSKCLIRVSVKDSGIGIPLEKQKLIFEEFSQADDSTSREYGGTGLGLSISNKIIQALGSQIEVESEEGKGSKFFFDIEFEIEDADDNHLAEFKKLKVAIVDPSSISVLQYSILQEYLESLCDVVEIENTSNKDILQKQDIIFVDESSVDDNLIELEDEDRSFVVLSENKVSCEKFKKGIILNTPLNTSALFDILVGFIDHDSFTEQNTQAETEVYTGSVLIAEDHEINQQLIAALLDIRGIKYTFANNGNEAVSLFEKGKYDLILMDINMPEKNGIEATIEIIEIEKQSNLTHTPIVALTANVIEADKQKIMDIGTDDYLYKPIDENRLDEVLHTYLQTTMVNEDLSEDMSYNLEEASVTMGINSIVVKKIVTNFCSTIDTDLENLKTSIEEKSFEQIKNNAHKIKGAALNLRMEKVAEFSGNIEQLAVDEEMKTIEENFTYLAKAIRVVQESIN